MFKMYSLDVCMIPCPQILCLYSLLICNPFDVTIIAKNHVSMGDYVIEIPFVVSLCSINPNGVESLTQNLRRRIILLNPVLLTIGTNLASP